MILQEEHEPRNGVYFLFLKGELQYIGRSVDIKRRLEAHARNPVGARQRAPKRWDEVKVILCKQDETERLEAECIMEYRPPLNKTLHYKKAGYRRIKPKFIRLQLHRPETFIKVEEPKHKTIVPYYPPFDVPVFDYKIDCFPYMQEGEAKKPHPSLQTIYIDIQYKTDTIKEAKP